MASLGTAAGRRAIQLAAYKVLIWQQVLVEVATWMSLDLSSGKYSNSKRHSAEFGWFDVT